MIGKHGCSSDHCVELVEHVINHCPHLKFSGLMTIGEMNYDWSQGGNPDFIVSKDLLILLWRHLHLKCSIFRPWSPLLESPGNFSSPKSNTFKIKMSSSRKYPYPPPPTEGNGNSEGRRGPKWGNFRGGGGNLSRSFFRGVRVRLVSYLNLTAFSWARFQLPYCLSLFQSKNYCFHRWSLICGQLSAFFMACTIVYVTRLSFAP